MKNSEKGKFEDAWHEAFQNAEQTPSENAWTGVEQCLNKAETAAMKSRVIFYQRLAAASILFALMLGGLSTYYISNLEKHQVISLTDSDSSTLLSTNEVDKGIVTPDESKIEDSNNDDFRANSSSYKAPIDGKSNRVKNLVEPLFNPLKDHELVSDNRIFDHSERAGMYNTYPSLLSLIPEPNLQLKNKMKEVVIVRKLPAMPASLMTSRNDKTKQEGLWASLGASTGNYSPSSDFNPTTSTASKVLYQNADALNGSTQAAYSTASSKGSVFSIGMNLGKRISNRWLVQGGVSYLNQAIGYTSNFALVDANNSAIPSVADYANLRSYSSVVSVSNPYQINSINKYISVPIQAGYLLIDKKLGLQLNSGVATDIFMRNTLTDESGRLGSYSSGAGESSPYRTVSWAGLMGTELSYKIATQYRVSIAPGLRYSINSVLKSNSTQSNPFMWDVGFRFRYIFN